MPACRRVGPDHTDGGDCHPIPGSDRYLAVAAVQQALRYWPALLHMPVLPLLLLLLPCFAWNLALQAPHPRPTPPHPTPLSHLPPCSRPVRGTGRSPRLQLCGAHPAAGTTDHLVSGGTAGALHAPLTSAWLPGVGKKNCLLPPDGRFGSWRELPLRRPSH
jgi:hypothetical protein